MNEVLEKLRPGSALHETVLTHLKERLDFSERQMQAFHPRWRLGERRVQAYIDHDAAERTLKELNEKSKSPKGISINLPYSYATISTIVTYLVHTFCARKPMFQVAATKGEGVMAAKNMETVLQYNSDHTNAIRHMIQWFNDGELYGLGILRNSWRDQIEQDLVWQEADPFTRALGQQYIQVEKARRIYSGNECATVDPFCFFPDPRVPMAEVSERGEWVFWRTFESKYFLKRMRAEGIFAWIEAAGSFPQNDTSNSDSARSLLAGGDAMAGYSTDKFYQDNFCQLDQGTVELIPAELGLTESSAVEKWLFTIVNKRQIIQAERFDAKHRCHPVSVIEPYTLGYAFGQPSLPDYLGPIQDVGSWIITSKIHNTRSHLNNNLVVNPSLVEMQDLARPGPERTIRLKPAAYGLDVRQAVMQLQVGDVTQNHFKDLETFIRFGDIMSAVNDNLRGVARPGGRKTATEVRIGGESGASRLAAHARLISAQGVSPMTRQWSLNLQQYLDHEFYIQVTGRDGAMAPITITPMSLVGDFHFPVHDGTLPLDKVALLDVWVNMFTAILGDPELRQTYSVPKIFEFISELGGAQNITSFRLQPNEVLEKQAQAGNMVPTNVLQR